MRFFGVGSFVTSYFRGLTFCDVSDDGGRGKIGQQVVTSFMDGPKAHCHTAETVFIATPNALQW